MSRFPAFKSLPPELQTLIWEAAIPTPRATVYHATLSYQPELENEDGTRGTNTEGKVHVRCVTEKLKPNAFINALSSLLLCCRSSSAVVVAAYRRHKPEVTMSLRDLPYGIDAKRDLLLVEHCWQIPLSKPPYVETLKQPRELHHVAIQWPGPPLTSPRLTNRGFVFENASGGFCNLWARTKAVYVVVEPEHLRQAQDVPWMDEDDCMWEYFTGYNGHSPRQGLAAFLEAYEDDQASGSGDTNFVIGNRMYYEVDIAELKEAGGLDEVVQFLYAAQQDRLYYNRYEDSPETTGQDHVRHMVLTWREVDEA